MTEEVLGIDLVEWMVKEASDELLELEAQVPASQGHSIQARIYAEDCQHDFRPSAGYLDQAVFSDHARNETWVRDGLSITTFYDPMLAKVIVHGENRVDALQKLRKALSQTSMYGVTTNLQYLQALLQEESCKKGDVFTQLLKNFAPVEDSVEVIDGGVQTTVQDYPGRTGHWDVGVPPCGAMDSYSFRIGNKLLGNQDDAAGLELTLRGGSYLFRNDMWFCVTGADMQVKLDGVSVQTYMPLLAKRGQNLVFGEAEKGIEVIF